MAQSKRRETAAHKALLSAWRSGFIDVLKQHGLCGAAQIQQVQQKSFYSRALTL